jgi:hypothetical protein
MGHRHAGAARVAVRAPKPPAMPDPDPQPPQPHSVSAARWLLMLLPSVLAIAAPFIGAFARRLYQHPNYRLDFRPELLCLAISTVLCFFLGFRLEKWRRGTSNDFEAAIGFGILILIVNGIIAFAGCCVPAMIF